MNFKELIWVEKYRPKKVSDIVLDEHAKIAIEKFASEQQIPNLLFVGPPGIGKTSLAKIIVKDILKCQYLYINASDENGIETIRAKINNFAQTKSFNGKIKCIILDESDGITTTAQRALRNTMEEYSSTTRFILTANELHKISDALISRCVSIDLRAPLEAVKRRIDFILNQENINDKDPAIINTIIEKYYPDIRQVINVVQQYCTTGQYNIDTTGHREFIKSIIMSIMKGEAINARKEIMRGVADTGLSYEEILRKLFNVIYELKIKNENKSDACTVIGEYLYKSAFVADQEINTFCCILMLEKILRR